MPKVITRMDLDNPLMCGCIHMGKIQLLSPPIPPTLKIMGSEAVTLMEMQTAIIVGCTQISPVTKPCTKIVFLRNPYPIPNYLKINGQEVLLDSAIGLTDGLPPGTLRFSRMFPVNVELSAIPQVDPDFAAKMAELTAKAVAYEAAKTALEASGLHGPAKDRAAEEIEKQFA